jgi:hypothetical protein
MPVRTYKAKVECRECAGDAYALWYPGDEELWHPRDGESGFCADCLHDMADRLHDMAQRTEAANDKVEDALAAGAGDEDG